jgi:hypothetical protein
MIASIEDNPNIVGGISAANQPASIVVAAPP